MKTTASFSTIQFTALQWKVT
eukprot:UN06613